jgi:hypothetical protein
MMTYDLDELFETSEEGDFSLPLYDLRHQFPDPEHKSELWFGPGFAHWIPERIANDHGWDMSGTFRSGSMVIFTKRKPKA